MNRKAVFIFFTILLALTLGACGGSSGGGGGGDGGGYVNDSTITVNGTTYLHEELGTRDPDIEGTVNYDFTTTHVNMSKTKINGVYYDSLVLIFPTTTIGSFQATAPGVYIHNYELTNGNPVFSCTTPTGGTITLTRNDAVVGGRLAGTFSDLSFSDTDCGRVFTGSFSVVITYVYGL